jgi:hypothetical protein
VALIFVSLGAGMAAQETHAVWYVRGSTVELPWRVRLLVSFVPPLSGVVALLVLRSILGLRRR